MLTNSRDIIRRLKKDGWCWSAVPAHTTCSKVPNPSRPRSFLTSRKTWDKHLSTPFIGTQAGDLTGAGATRYIANIEDAGRDCAVGVWFPDLPGCFSADDDPDEALRNAPEALELYLENFIAEKKPCRSRAP